MIIRCVTGCMKTVLINHDKKFNCFCQHINTLSSFTLKNKWSTSAGCFQQSIYSVRILAKKNTTHFAYCGHLGFLHPCMSKKIENSFFWVHCEFRK